MDRIIIRSAAVRVFVAVLLVLVGLASSAHGSRGTPPGTPPVAPENAREVRVAGALFTPTRVDDGLEWRARWILTPEDAEDIAQGATRAVRFAVPLTDAETVETTWGVVPFAEAGQVVGVLVDRAATDGNRPFTATVHQRTTRDAARGLRIGAPIAAGNALQIIDADLGAATRLEVATGRILERRVGYVAPPGVSHAAREEARRLTGYDARVRGAAIYVRGDDVKSASSLTAVIVTPRARGHRGTIGLAVVFGIIVIALVAAVKRLRHAASVERADAVLAAEVDALDPTPQAGQVGQGAR